MLIMNTMGVDFQINGICVSVYSNSCSSPTQHVLKSTRILLKQMPFHWVVTGFPVLSIGVTALKLVFKPKALLNAGGGKFNRVKIHQLRHVPSACAPDRGGVAELAAVWACVHKSLAAWLALHVFVNSLQIKLVITPMLSAEP